jgi:parvulin-like peptidyl-prolyl isomerase
MAAYLKSGKDFDSLAKKAIEDKIAKGSVEAQFVPASQLLPHVAADLEKLKTGEVTSIIRVPDGYTMMKLEGVRYPEDQKARKVAEENALSVKKNEVLKKYFEGLRKKYVVVNKKLLKGLDFEKSEAEFTKLFKDKRSLVKIKGDNPITVGQLTEAINKKFFHGIAAAIRDKKINSIKDTVLEEIIYKRLAMREAKALGIDQSAEYKDALTRYERSVLFVAFIQTAIVPDIKVSEDESKKYYEDHISDYTTPDMMRLYSIGFYKLADAEDTLKKLQRGDDFKWLQSNASGQLKEDASGSLSLNGDVFTVNGLDEGLRKALTGVKTGDYRIYSDGKYYYVIYVLENIPPKKQDYKEARESTAKKVFNEKVNQAVQDWASKLRKAYKVKVYITGISTTKAE